MVFLYTMLLHGPLGSTLHHNIHQELLPHKLEVGLSTRYVQCIHSKGFSNLNIGLKFGLHVLLVMQDQMANENSGLSEEDMLTHLRQEKFQSIIAGTSGADECCCICQVRCQSLICLMSV